MAQGRLLLQLSDASLTLGGAPLLRAASLAVAEGDKLALVGRNGSGKSSLLKLMAGQIEPDEGARALGQGASVAVMAQDPDMSGFDTLGDWASEGLDPGDLWRVEAAGEGLSLDLARPVGTASGGERRRAALARALAADADLTLLDEPTNHLDIDAIAWLEERLAEPGRSFVLISHDRMILRRVTNGVLWLDRGVLRRRDKGFDGFEDWRDTTWAEEDLQRHKLERKIKAEARWAVEGISARRKRNQGRVRALQDLRATRAGMVQRQGTAALDLDSGRSSGRKVIEAQGLSKRFADRIIARDFDLRIMRGDRVAFVGPNGVGKTTLIELLLKQQAPDAGTVTHGSALDIAVFDQNRAALDPDATLWASLTDDKALGVPGRADQVMVRGQPKHIVGYLKDFLFDEAQARAPVRSLSGGEKARLLLARLMAQPANLLVMDEPTNDLDIETLDLLQEILDDFDGTVLLVSHDRDFIDRVATTTVALEGQGRITVHAGGWSDYAPKRRLHQDAPVKPAKPKEKTPEKPKKGNGLSFTERHRLEALPAEIARLEAEIAKLGQLLSDPDLFTANPTKFNAATRALAERQAKLSAAEDEWLTLEDKAASE